MAYLKVWRWLAWAIGVSLFTACSSFKTPAPAAPAAWIEKFEVTSRKPAYGGSGFGLGGRYEVVSAIAQMRIDPWHAANRDIADLKLAAEPDGFVRYRTDVVILRPVDASKASGVLLFEVPTRGVKPALALLNDGGGQPEQAADAGHGWVMRNGHTMVWVGWQGDVALGGGGGVVGTELPKLGDERRPVVGRTQEEFVFDTPETTLRARLTYPTASTDTYRARMRVRQKPEAPATTLPDEAWRFTNDSEIELTRPDGFDGGAIYQLTYDARDPWVMGLGFAAVRDIASFLKTTSADAAGQSHPLSDIKPSVTLAVGVSQAGRFLRDFIWQGFNAAVAGGRVFDGTMVLLAGADKGSFNLRWAQPNHVSRQQEDHWTYGDQFPFSYGVIADPVSTRRDGIFAKCLANQSCPRTMQLDSSQEYWQSRASLVTTDGAGHDLALPEDVRVYLMSSTQHFPAASPQANGICRQPTNPVPQSSTVRALLVKLVDWARNGAVPPASQVPTVAAGTLAAPSREAAGFPELAGVGVEFPAHPNELTVVDYAALPPKADPFRSYKLMVPRTDKDGHDVAGVRVPDIEVPLGTHTGWNLRKEGFGPGQLCGLNGMYVPFAADAVSRVSTQDSRASIVERYPSRLHYVQRMQASAEWLKAEGLMLDEDVGRWVDRARVQAQDLQQLRR